MQSDYILTTQELADHLKVSKAHILREVRAGRLRPLRLGPKTLRFQAAELLRYQTECGHASA